jgi:hippurate hydrolase
MRAEAKLDYEFSYPVTRNDEDAVRLALKVASGLFGEERAVELDNPSMGGEDFAFFLEKLPGAYVWLGVGEETSKLHTPTFDFDEAILPRGAALLTALALESLR